MVEEEAEDIAERAVVVDDFESGPGEIHAEMLHVAVDSAEQFVAVFVFVPAVGAGGHVAEGDDDEVSAGFEEADNFFAGGFEIIDVDDGEVAENEIEVVVGAGDGFGERFDVS